MDSCDRDSYDRDFYLWTAATAAALRAGRISEVDIEHVAEEIEDMGKRDRRELKSGLRQILERKLRLELVGRQTHAYNERGWRASIAR